MARGIGLEIIPMVPIYAHLEFALAHEPLAPLREKPEIMAKICARKPEAVKFVQNLLVEVLEFHTEDRYIHLGADEVWHTEWCEECAKRIKEVGPARMWADHITPMLEFVLGHGKRPIIFDDIFWKDPESIRGIGLPQETVLHSWNYGVTELVPKGTPVVEEMGGPQSALRCVDVYRNAGFDSLAGPCCNMGQIIPRHSHCLKNTQAWETKMRAAGMLGMLNTAWAVFHIPLPMTNLQVAATGRLAQNPDADLGLVWQENWLEEEFGASANGVPEALETLGEGWEIRVPGYARPFTPLVYGYMNMVFHYPGGHDDRKRRGPYPLDWNEINFCEVYRKGVEAAKRSPDLDRTLASLDEKLAAFPVAVATVRDLATRAIYHRDDAEMLATLAQLKYVSLRVFNHLVRDGGNLTALQPEIHSLEPLLRKAMANAWEPEGRERMWRAWWEPITQTETKNSVSKEMKNDMA
jgi:hypothetical protein